MLRVNSDDPNLEEAVSFDVNGNPIYHYMGKPFTGIIEDYENGILVGEFEKEDGSQWGVQREYYPNGAIESEYYIGPGGFHGRSRMWDTEGNMTSDDLWLVGVHQASKSPTSIELLGLLQSKLGEKETQAVVDFIRNEAAREEIAAQIASLERTMQRDVFRTRKELEEKIYTWKREIDRIDQRGSVPRWMPIALIVLAIAGIILFIKIFA